MSTERQELLAECPGQGRVLDQMAPIPCLEDLREEEGHGWLSCHLWSDMTIQCPYSSPVHFKMSENGELSWPSELGATAFQK